MNQHDDDPRSLPFCSWPASTGTMTCVLRAAGAGYARSICICLLVVFRGFFSFDYVSL